MDSSFKNDQLRQLNLRIGYPEEPLKDEYEKETIFEYLYEINKELHSYHEILESIKKSVDSLKDSIENIETNTNTTVTQLTVNEGLSLDGYRVADVMCKIYDILNNVQSSNSLKVDLRYVDGDSILYRNNSDGELYGVNSIVNLN